MRLDVLEESDGALELPAVDGLGGLAGVLERAAEVGTAGAGRLRGLDLGGGVTDLFREFLSVSALRHLSALLLLPICLPIEPRCKLFTPCTLPPPFAMHEFDSMTVKKNAGGSMVRQFDRRYVRMGSRVITHHLVGC